MSWNDQLLGVPSAYLDIAYHPLPEMHVEEASATLHFWVINDVKATEQALGQPIAYCYMTRDANCIVDNMARQALEVYYHLLGWAGA